MFVNYFHPLSNDFISFKEKLNQNQIGYHIDCYCNDSFPSFHNADIALIFIPENRGSYNVELTNTTHSFLRKSFYSLFQGIWKFRLIDFGDLKRGDTVKDTYFALNDIISNLLSQSVFPIIIGGTNDLVFPIYSAYESFSKGVNLLCVDAKFD